MLNYKDNLSIYPMNHLLSLPDDVFKQQVLQYLTLEEIRLLDNSFMSHKYRPQFLDKLSDIILLGNEIIECILNKTILNWLYKRKIYLKYAKVSGEVLRDDDILDIYQIFRYCEFFVIYGVYTIDLTITGKVISYCKLLKDLKLSFYKAVSHHEQYKHVVDTSLNLNDILPHCLELHSLDLSGCTRIRDISSITQYCTGLQKLNLSCFYYITDLIVISIAENCTKLISLNLNSCDNLSDESIVAISQYCKGLQLLELTQCYCITDKSIISISKNCLRLKSLSLNYCGLITDNSIISLAQHCFGLQSLEVAYCINLTDDSIILLSKYCNDLQILDLAFCTNLSDYCIYKYHRTIMNYN